MTARLGKVLLLALPLRAESSLSLDEAVRTALEKQPSVEASAARVKAAEARIHQARGGYLPKVNYSESYQRSDNPVFVFSALLTQHQFTEKNFSLDLLNRPDAVNNFQSQVSVDQVIYDPGQIRSQVRSAELGKTMADEDGRRAGMRVIAAVVRDYFGAVLSQETLHVAREAVHSAEADLNRAEAVRSAGMSTDADVLSIRVHLAAMHEQEIRRTYDLEVAQAALNEAMGLPLEMRHDLTTALTPVALSDRPLGEYEKKSLAARPEARQAQLAAHLAETQAAAARASLLPQVGFRSVFEADRQRLVTRGGTNWLLAASLRWNLFNGFADKARIAEAGHALDGVKAQQRQVDAGIRLEVRQAHANLNASQERIGVAAAAVAMAEESLRITKNRYEAGLNMVTELLRSETALLEARTRRLAAIYDQRVAAAMLELAAGTLAGDSDVLK